MSRLASFQTDIDQPGKYPIEPVTGHNLFPPVCLKTHWDPTLMLRKYILPSQQVALPLDFRPYTKVCKNYVTSGPAEKAPLPPANMVFPMGGEFYPPGRYSNAIDSESSLRTLDHPLDRWCSSRQYIVSPDSTMYKPNYTVPERTQPPSAFVQELSMPQALLRPSGYTCRTENDVKLWMRSPRLFNNPTKQDRLGSETFYALTGGVIEMPHGGVYEVPLTEQAAKGAYPVQYPGSGPASMPMGEVQFTVGERNAPKKEKDRSKILRVAGVTTTGMQAPI